MCKKTKAEVDFSRNKKSQLSSRCKPCTNENSAKWRRDNPEKERNRIRGIKPEYAATILTKKCPRCGEIKNRDGFYVNEKHENGLSSQCKTCAIAMSRQNAIANPERIRASAAAYSIERKEEIKLSRRAYYVAHRTEIAAKNREYRLERAEELKEFDRLRRPQIYAQRNARYKKDSLYRLSSVLRCRTGAAFKAQGLKKSGRTLDFLGCSPAELQAYLASQFDDTMTIENHGEVWDIDHIIPCSAWDLNRDDHIRACFHYTNLQPLCKVENRWVKGGACRHPPGHYNAAIAEHLMVLKNV